MTLDALATMLSLYHFRYTSERELQDGIEYVLIEHNIPHHREFYLGAPDRPDFLLESGIAIEVKIKGSLADLLRQASRYAGHAEVTGILVVGTPRWLPRVPSEFNGKPVRSVRLIGSML